MGNGIDIATLADVAKDPAAAKGVLEWMQEANKFLKEASSMLQFAKQIGVSPEVLEKLIIQWKGLDKVPSLPRNDNIVIPASGTHKMMFDALNQMGEKQLQDLAKTMQEQGKEEEPKKKSK